MKKILLLIPILLIGCKTVRTESETKNEVKKDITTIKDSTDVKSGASTTVIVDTSNMIVYIYDEWFAEPDSSGVQYPTRITKTEIIKGRKVVTASKSHLLDSVKVITLNKDKTSLKEAAKAKTKSETNNPFRIKPVVLIVLGLAIILILLFIWKKEKKNIFL